MKDSIKIKFLAKYLDVKVPATENTKFCELVRKFFEIRNVEFEKNKEKITYKIGSNNIILKWNLLSTVKELGLKNNGIVYVIDSSSTIINMTKEQASKISIKSVAKEKTEKNFPEKFPDILGEMVEFSEECLVDVLDDLNNDCYNYKDYNYALGQKMKDRHIFLFGLIGKYLKEFLDVNVYINIKLSEEKKYRKYEKMKGLLTLRYLSNGFITKKKTIVTLSQKLDSNMYDDKIAKDINNKLKNNLMQEYTELKDDNFVVTSIPNFDFLKILLVKVKEKDVKLEQTKIVKSCQKTGFFKNEEIKIEEDKPLIETIILDKSFLFPQLDSNDDSVLGYNEERGNEKYYPPVGWWRFGALAYNMYGKNNDWLSYKSKSWCVAYVGLRKIEIEEKVKEFENDEDIRHRGKKVGLGVAVCQNPDDMEKDCEEIEVGNEAYKIGFMLRINPEAIRIPKSGNGKYWVVSGTKEDLRPYSILSKRVRPKLIQ